MKPYKLTRPCDLCPFRSDIEPFLRPGRVDEIERSLVRGEFPCHNTVNYDRPRRRMDESHCAGALILLEKLGRPSQMMRISERLGMYDPRKLDMTAPVFESFEQMREAMWRGRA